MQLSPRAYKVVTFAIAISALLVVAELLSAQAETLSLPIWFYVVFSAAVLGAVWLMMSHLLTQEAALRNSRANILAVFGAVDDGFITLDTEGRIIYFSDAARRIFDCTVDDIRDMPFDELFASDSRAVARDALAQMMADNSNELMDFDLDLAGVRADGNAFPLRIAKAMRSRSESRDMFIMVRDMSEQFRLDRLKQEFVSTISHELRTPLTSIQGSLGLIRAGVVGEMPEKMAGMIDIAHNNGERLVELINDILDVEKIESGKMVFRKKVSSLTDIVEAAIEQENEAAQHYGVTVQFDRPANTHSVNVDGDRLVQVVVNLLSNAIKFSDSGDEVRVSLNADGQCVRCTVSDHGPGIAPELQAGLFDRFSRIDGADTRERGGTGLGLAISRAILREHDGEISVDSEVGKGSSFFFELPFVGVIQGNTPQEADLPQNSDGKLTILVCEDDASVAELLVQIVEQEGYHPVLAKNAGEARQLLDEQKFDAITLDLRLPDEDGLGFLKWLRANPTTEGIPIVVVSAIASEGRDDPELSAIKVVDWMDKPFDQGRLVEHINQIASSVDGRKPLVLHVEDDSDIADVVSASLDGLVQIERASSLERARQALASKNYDLMILDLSLPDGRGEDLLTALVEEMDVPVPPVVVFSAYEIAEEDWSVVSSVLLKSRTSTDEFAASIKSLLMADRTSNAAEPRHYG